VHQRPQTLARACVPDADQAVPGTGDDQGAVADEVDAADGVRVRGEGAEGFSGADVPEEDGFVVGA